MMLRLRLHERKAEVYTFQLEALSLHLLTCHRHPLKSFGSPAVCSIAVMTPQTISTKIYLQQLQLRCQL
jgi:hypothetical protein